MIRAAMIAPPLGGLPVPTRLRAQTRDLVNAEGLFRPRFTSALTLLTKSDDERDRFLDWIVRTGFNGLRVFAGHLSWAGQTAASARARLPALLDATAARRLYVEVAALTDTREGGFDTRAHVAEIVAMSREQPHVLLEIANEPWHQTQDDQVQDPEYLLDLYLDLVAPAGILCALGAPPTDEPTAAGTFPHPAAAADYLTLHLDRGRDAWQQIRRVRELEAVSAITRAPVMNNEPIGAAETPRPGARLSDPSLFFTLGILNRIFEIGGVYHSQHGLMTEPPGPVQQACAEAYVTGARLIEEPARLTFKNARWADSPIANANFHDETGQGGTVVRVYTGVAGNRAWTVCLGLTGDPGLRLQNGWRIRETLAERPGVQVLGLEQG